MPRSLRVTCFLAFAVGASLLGGSNLVRASEPKDDPQHLAVAAKLAAEIGAADNEYAHKECFITWKGVDGATKYANRTDCSDFFNLLIEHVYGFTTQQVKAWTGHARPTAAEWFDAAGSPKTEALFTSVATIDAVLPGDVLFIKYPPGEADTGHVMIVASKPKKRTATEPVEEKTTQWEVDVIDSSKSGHGPTDTRHQADGKYSGGVGRGVLRLYAEADGKLAGYSWSTLKVSKFEPASRHPLVVVRLKPVKSEK